MENTREIVLDALLTLEREQQYSNQLIAAVLDKYDYLDARDKAFMKRLFEGTVERKIELDYHLDRISSVPVHKMKPLMRCLIRMSAYQILYMENVPDRAAVDEAVKLARKRKFTNLSGFVNGVLRSLIREKENLEWPDPKKETDLYLSVKYSVPKWIVTMWRKQYGVEQTEDILQHLLQIHPVSLRFVSTLTPDAREKWVRKIEETGAICKQISSAPVDYVYTLENAGNLAFLPGYEEGVFTIQDLSSAKAVEYAQIQEGDFVLDACAAPGGKSILAAEKTGPGGRVLSRDLSEQKVARIQENVDRMKASHITAQVHDATVFDPEWEKKVDVLLLDVPCSGLGILGKKRDIKYHVTPESLKEIVQLQRQIITACWRYVKPGGTLLYSTCTIHKGENEEQVKWICENFPFVEPDEMVQLLPSDTQDGFFYAKLERKYPER